MQILRKNIKHQIVQFLPLEEEVQNVMADTLNFTTNVPKK